MAEDIVELLMEGVDNGANHWDTIKDKTKAATGLRGGQHRTQDRADNHSKSDRRDSSRSRRKSVDNGRSDWHDGYDSRQDDIRSPFDSSASQYRRPGVQRRASSMDRDQFSRDRRPRHDHYYSSDSESSSASGGRRHRRRSDVPKDGRGRKAWDSMLLSKNDTTSAVAAGLATVGTVYAASKLYDAYRDRNKPRGRSSHGRSTRRK